MEIGAVPRRLEAASALEVAVGAAKGRPPCLEARQRSLTEVSFTSSLITRSICVDHTSAVACVYTKARRAE